MDPTTQPAERTGRPRRWRRRLKWGALGVVGLLVLSQAVPYGRSHSNPPVTAEPAWDSPTTAALVQTSCGDCHSNKTKWLWYSNIAPVSWLIQNDVDGGRRNLNFSEWDKPQDGASDIIEQIQNGSMPPRQYTLIHRGAGLSQAERDQLISGLNTTFRASPPVPGKRGGG